VSEEPRQPELGDIVEVRYRLPGGEYQWACVKVDATFLAFKMAETFPSRWRWPGKQP
jgi:hypothetical protein